MNSFKEETHYGIGLIHNVLRGWKRLACFPMGGTLCTHFRLTFPFKRVVWSLFNFY